MIKLKDLLSEGKLTEINKNEGEHIFKHVVRVKSFLIWFIIQIPYVVLKGILSFFTSELKWKERTNQ